MSAKPRIRVLLTVPQLASTASPYRELMALVRYLPREEFELTVCSLRENGLREAEPVLAARGVRTLVARFRPRHHGWRPAVSSFRDQRRLEEIGPFDIQHSLDFTCSPFEAAAARARRRRYVFHQRDLLEVGSRALLRMKIRLASRIIAISQAVVEFLLDQGAPASKVRKVYNGLDLDEVRAAARNGSGRGYVLSVGHILRRKRHADAIRTLALVASELPGLRLRIAGEVYEADHFEELKRLAGELGVAERVEFLGPRTDVPELMQGAEALLHCAESDAFGWVIVEAMASGLPVIAPAVLGPSEIIEDRRTGLLAPVGDVPAYAEALRAVIGNPNLARWLAEGARRTVEQKFSARPMVEQLAAVYREVTAAG